MARILFEMVVMIELTSGDSGLEDLFTPWSVGTFAAVAWEKKPVVVRGGAQRFAGLVSPAELVRVAARGSAHLYRERRMISVDTPGRLAALSSLASGQRAPLRSLQTAPGALGSGQPETLLEEPAAGALYAVSGLHLQSPLVAALARRIKVALGHPGAVEAVAWLSGPGAGMPLHLGSVPTLSLQISGEKRWRVSRRPVLPWSERPTYWLPPGGEPETTDGDAEPAIPVGELVEVTLGPGDLLWLPSGSWHETTAGAEGSLSLHLRLPPTPVRVLIERALEQVAALDRPLPLSPSLAAGSAPGVVKDALASALAAVSVELSSLPLDGYEWAALHRELLTEAATAIDDTRTTDLEPGQALRWTAEGLAGCVVAADRDGARRVTVHVQGAELSFGDEALVAYAERLLRAPSFVAGDTVAWLPRGARSWPQARALLGALISIGALERRYSMAEASGSSRPISSTRRR